MDEDGEDNEDSDEDENDEGDEDDDEDDEVGLCGGRKSGPRATHCASVLYTRDHGRRCQGPAGEDEQTEEAADIAR